MESILVHLKKCVCPWNSKFTGMILRKAVPINNKEKMQYVDLLEILEYITKELIVTLLFLFIYTVLYCL